MAAAVITCPHCAGRVGGGAYCQSCGKALPFATRTAPRLIFGDNLPVGVIARQVVGHELRKQTNQAANTLLGVGILQLIIGSVIYGVATNAKFGLPEDAYYHAMGLFISGGIFLCLYSWAWKSPLAPSIVGLVIYGTLILLEVWGTVSGGRVGGRGTGPAGIGVGYLDVVIIVVLYQGIRAAVRHRKLRDRRAGAGVAGVQGVADEGAQEQW